MNLLAKVPEKYRRWVLVGVYFSVFLISMLVIAPLIQTHIIEPNQPYLIIDPEVPVDGCQYDYLNYIPIELTGRPLSEGKILHITSVPVEYKEYVHYPDTWGDWNPFNPEGILGNWLSNTLLWITAFVFALFVAYLLILHRQGKLKKLYNKYFGSEK